MNAREAWERYQGWPPRYEDKNWPLRHDYEMFCVGYGMASREQEDPPWRFIRPEELKLDVSKFDEESDPCVCGHERRQHVYHAGPCRPGFLCSDRCPRFVHAR